MKCKKKAAGTIAPAERLKHKLFCLALKCKCQYRLGKTFNKNEITATRTFSPVCYLIGRLFRRVRYALDQRQQ